MVATVRCLECSSSFGHDEGCAQITASMKRDALIAGKSVPVPTIHDDLQELMRVHDNTVESVIPGDDSLKVEKQ